MPSCSLKQVPTSSIIITLELYFSGSFISPIPFKKGDMIVTSEYLPSVEFNQDILGHMIPTIVW